MKVLMISGDANILKEGTVVYKRAQLQRAQVEQLDIFVWPHIHSRREILRAARTETYDVVTSQDPFWRGLLAWRAARLSGARLNVQVHADLEGQSFAKRVLARFVLRRANSIRVVSEKIRQQAELLGTSSKITVLPVYIDIERFRAIRREPHDRKNILWIGRFEEEKNPEAALTLWQSVRAAGMDVSLVMLGAGSLGTRLKSAYNLNRAEWPVEFPGWADPLLYIAKADVAINTSKHESFGAAIVEVLAAGVPVVALEDVGIAREAGAIIVPKENKMVDVVIDVLKNGIRGELKLDLPSAPEWAKQWKETLA